MVLGGLEDTELPSTEAGVDGLRLAHLILLVEAVGRVERAFVLETFRCAAGGLGLPLPADGGWAVCANSRHLSNMRWKGRRKRNSSSPTNFTQPSRSMFLRICRSPASSSTSI